MKKAKPAKRAKAKKTDAEARPGSDDSIKANSGSDDDDSIRARSGYAAPPRQPGAAARRPCSIALDYRIHGQRAVS
jgi:hypothetical protein